jgi:hypothetical protein
MNKFTQLIKIFSIITIFLVVSYAPRASAITMDELINEINSLKEEINSLRGSLGANVYSIFAGTDTSYVSGTGYNNTTTGTNANNTTIGTNANTTTQTSTINGTTTTSGTQTISNTGYATGSGNSTGCLPGVNFNTSNGQPCHPNTTNVDSNYSPITGTSYSSNSSVGVGTESLTSFSRYLSYGTRNDTEVKRLQDFLILYGYLEPGLNTGSYLSKTAGALMAFQKANNISGDGRNVGPKTISAINKTQKELQPPVLPGGTTSVSGIQRFSPNTTIQMRCVVGISAPSITIVTSPNTQTIAKKGTEIDLTWTNCELGSISQYKFYFRNYESLQSPGVRFSIGGTLVSSSIVATGSSMTAKVLVPQELPIGFYDILVEAKYNNSYVTKASSRFKITSDACLSATVPTLSTSWYSGSMRISSAYNNQIPVMFAWDVCGAFPSGSTGQIDIKRESDGLVQSVIFNTPNDGYERVQVSTSNLTPAEYRFRFISGTISSNWSSKFQVLP